MHRPRMYTTKSAAEARILESAGARSHLAQPKEALAALLSLVRARDTRLGRQREVVDERETSDVARGVRSNGSQTSGRVMDRVRSRIDGGEHRLAVDEKLH